MVSFNLSIRLVTQGPNKATAVPLTISAFPMDYATEEIPIESNARCAIPDLHVHLASHEHALTESHSRALIPPSDILHAQVSVPGRMTILTAGLTSSHARSSINGIAEGEISHDATPGRRSRLPMDTLMTTGGSYTRAH